MRPLLVAVIGLAVPSLAGCSKKEQEEPTPVVTVDVAPVLLSQIQRTIRAEGLIYPKQQAAIVPKITAPIKKTYVQRGTTVRAGQLLLELENQDLAGADGWRWNPLHANHAAAAINGGVHGFRDDESVRIGSRQ